MTKLDSSFAPTVVDYHLFPDMNFIGHCLVKNNISIPRYRIWFGIGFDSRSEFSLPDSSIKKNVIVFGADISSSVHTDNNTDNILILGEGPTQGLDDTTLVAKTKYPINFTQSGKRFVLSLHCNESKSFLFISGPKIY